MCKRLCEAASDLDEITTLQQCSKKLGLIVQLIEVVAVEGLESDAFKDVYDTIDASAPLVPAVELEMPVHLIYARHAIDVRSTSSVQRFMLCIASSELRDRCVGDGCDVVVEQAGQSL